MLKALELLIEAYVEYRHHCDTLDREEVTPMPSTAKMIQMKEEREIRMIKRTLQQS